MSKSDFRLSYDECRVLLRQRLAEDAPGRIQLLSGPRQVGKTTLLLELAKERSNSALYAAGDSPEAALPGFWERLWNRAERLALTTRAIVLLDEAHLLPNWAARLKGEWDRFRRRKTPIHVVATGSAALQLSAGSRESLAGRFEKITLTHWTARSLATSFNMAPESAAELIVSHGSYPGAIAYLKDPARWSAYVRDAILDPAIGRDILALAPVRKPALLRQVFGVCASSPAQIISLQKIQSQLQDSGALETIAHYLVTCRWIFGPVNTLGQWPFGKRGDHEEEQVFRRWYGRLPDNTHDRFHYQSGRPYVMRKVIGLDIAKRVFQLHSVDPATGEIERRKLSRGELLEYFGKISPATVAMEACGSSQHWARRFSAMGHEARLIATKFVRPFVKTNKTDAADAAAVWEAAQRPGMRFVPVKSEQQQGILALHNMRDLLVKSRTAQIHQIRAVFYEYGIDLPRGRHWSLKAMPTAFARAEGRIETVVIEALRAQLELIHDMSRRIEGVEKQLQAYERSDERCLRLRAIPGVGPLTATAVVASVGDAREFRSGREFAAWLGVVPRQSGTGGRVRLLSISKRGNPYLRVMIIHCARAVAARQRVQPPWLLKLLQTKHWNVAVVALANKLARVIWALLAHGRSYQADWAAASSTRFSYSNSRVAKLTQR